MSESRQKYSSSPLYGLKNSRGNGGGFQVPPERQQRPQRQQKRRNFTFLQIAMTAVLPLVFLVAMILGYTEVHWAFLALSALALIVMWGGGAFVQQARTTMTLIYTALMIVSLAAALWFTQPLMSPPEDNTTGIENDLSSLFGRDVTASDVGAYAATMPSAEPEAPAPQLPDSRSEAQSRLEVFMNSWMSLDYDGMLACCTPSWINAQEDAKRAMFNIRGTNTPTDYEITYVAGSDSDDSRTITMTADLQRATGRTATYRYEVLMLRINGTWYVDPASLSSATEIKATVTIAPTYTLMPTYTPDPNMTVYYNPDGGSYYHANQNCTKVSNKYLPLKGSFLMGQKENNAATAGLKPCAGCNAP